MTTWTRLSAMSALVLLAGAAAASARSLSPADRQFLDTAARADMTEAHEGQVIAGKADTTEVRAFAKTLDQDHEKSYEEITNLAAKDGVNIPKGIDITKDRPFDQLMTLSGSRLDHQFAEDEIRAHRREIALFRREAAHAGNRDVRAYAAEMIPVLEMHLRLAEECAKARKPV